MFQMNSKGMIDTEHTARRANEIAGDEPKRYANALKMAEICNKGKLITPILTSFQFNF